MLSLSYLKANVIYLGVGQNIFMKMSDLTLAKLAESAPTCLTFIQEFASCCRPEDVVPIFINDYNNLTL